MGESSQATMCRGATSVAEPQATVRMARGRTVVRPLFGGGTMNADAYCIWTAKLMVPE